MICCVQRMCCVQVLEPVCSMARIRGSCPTSPSQCHQRGVPDDGYLWFDLGHCSTNSDQWDSLSATFPDIAQQVEDLLHAQVRQSAASLVTA